jgi:hypothetical protein
MPMPGDGSEVATHGWNNGISFGSDKMPDRDGDHHDASDDETIRTGDVKAVVCCGREANDEQRRPRENE